MEIIIINYDNCKRHSFSIGSNGGHSECASNVNTLNLIKAVTTDNDMDQQ